MTKLKTLPSRIKTTPQQPQANNSNRSIIIGIIIASLCTCFIGMAVLGRLGQNENPPANVPPSPINTPTEMERYRLEMFENVNLLAGGLDKLDSLLKNPSLNDQNWINQTALAVTIVRLSHERITKANPPPEMLNTHSFILDATRDCDRSMDFLVDGIDKRNRENVNKALELIQSCGEKIKKATQAMEQN